MTGDEAIRELGELLREAGARVTLDQHRSISLPCVLCSTISEPRDLVRIGTYTRPMGGNLRPGDAIVRPMCVRCRELTEPAPPAVAVDHDPGDEDRRPILLSPWCTNCGDAFDGPERPCPCPSPGEPYKDCGRGGHMFRLDREPAAPTERTP